MPLAAVPQKASRVGHTQAGARGAADASQKRRQGQREDRHPEFEAGVHGEGPPQSPGEPSETEPAEGEPRHERGEHDARGLEAGAEDERQVADPRDLVDQRGATRQQEQQVDESTSPGRHPRRSTLAESDWSVNKVRACGNYR
jgi:hypothetical protein